MELTAGLPVDGDGAAHATTEMLDLGALPSTLVAQCRGLIESYHDIHGYACLPDMLWRAQLEGFIRKQACLRQILRKASTTRSAKVAHKGFVEIATAILSLEILASDFASWSMMFPEARSVANALLRTRSSRMFLMQYYLYPQRHISPAVLAALAPPVVPSLTDPGRGGPSSPELSSQRVALNYASAMRETLAGKPEFAAGLPPAPGWQ